jgi:hypothetical protein
MVYGEISALAYAAMLLRHADLKVAAGLLQFGPANPSVNHRLAFRADADQVTGGWRNRSVFDKASGRELRHFTANTVDLTRLTGTLGF